MYDFGIAFDMYMEAFVQYLHKKHGDARGWGAKILSILRYIETFDTISNTNRVSLRPGIQSTRLMLTSESKRALYSSPNDVRGTLCTGIKPGYSSSGSSTAVPLSSAGCPLQYTGSACEIAWHCQMGLCDGASY